MLVLVLKDQNAVLVLVLDDAVLVLAAEVLEQKSFSRQRGTGGT